VKFTYWYSIVNKIKKNETLIQCFALLNKNKSKTTQNIMSFNQNHQLPLNRNEKMVLSLVQFLKEKDYLQVKIVEKINALGFKLGTTNYNKLVNLAKNKQLGRSVGQLTVKGVIPRLKTIIFKELGYEFDENSLQFTKVKNSNWKPEIIANTGENEFKATISDQAIIHSEGKRPLNEKLELLQKAQDEYLELGLNLKNIIRLLTEESIAAFREPLLKKLKAGLQVDFYVLNPNGRFYSEYLKDRAKVQEDEHKTLERFKEEFKELKSIIEDLNKETQKGKIRLFIYNTFPYCHATIIDSLRIHSQMLLTNYLYGVRRVDCPVVEVMKNQHRKMFEIYWKSVLNIISQSQQIL